MDLITVTSDVNITSNSVFNQTAISSMNETLNGADNADICILFRSWHNTKVAQKNNFYFFLSKNTIWLWLRQQISLLTEYHFCSAEDL
jgi:hypothetical protein